MKKLLIKAEFAFVIIALILCSGGPLTVILSGGASEGDGGKAEPDFSLIRSIFLAVYFVTAMLIIPLWRKAAYLLIKEKFILLLTMFTLTSCLWSFLPNLTLQRSIGLVGTTLFGVYLAARYPLKDQIKILGWTLSLIILMSFTFAIGLHQYGVMGGIHAGAWRGIYTHKNVLGKIMVLSTTYFWFRISYSRTIDWRFWLGCCASILLLVLARSSSSLVNFLVLTFTSFAFQTLKWRDRFAIPAILFLLAIISASAFLVTLNLDTLLGFVGKDATFTGRSDLWPAVITMIQRQPWIGYGFSGFWNDFNSEGGYVWKATQWTPPNAHNGILDLLLDLGVVGFSLFLASYLCNLIKSIAIIRATRSSEGIWALLFSTWLILVNTSESSLLIQNNIFWVLYVSIALSLCHTSLISPQPSVSNITSHTNP